MSWREAGTVATCDRAYSGTYGVRTSPCDREAGHPGFCQFVAQPRRTRLEHAWDLAAVRLGLDGAEYSRRRLAGERWCKEHGAWLPADAFYACHGNALCRRHMDALTTELRDRRQAS